MQIAEQPLQKRAVIYCRVSSVRQSTEGHGLTSQQSRCEDYCRNKGYEVAAVFTDDVSGGGDFMKRPGMVRLLHYLDAHPDESFAVVFDDLKRFSRDTVFHLKLAQEMSLRNATRECLNFSFENSPEGAFIETIIAAQGQLEREQNSRQVKQKMQARIFDGYWCSHNPPGYKYTKASGHGKLLVRDEPLASIIAEGLVGFSTQRFQSQNELRQFFERFPEFPRGKNGEIHYQRVKDMLQRIIYAGYIDLKNWGMAPIQGKHEPLISLETYLKNQELLQNSAKAPVRIDTNKEFVLRGMVACGDCGKPYTACFSKGRSKSYAYYLCNQKGCNSYGKSIPRDTIEGEFEAILADMQPSKDVIATASKMFRIAWDMRLNNGKVVKQSVEKEIKAVDAAIEQLLDRIVNTTNLSVVNAYEKRIEDLEVQKIALGEKLAQSGGSTTSFDKAFRTAMIFLSQPHKIFTQGGFEEKMMVVRMAFSKKLEYVRNQGFRTAQKALPFLLLEGFSNHESEMVEDTGVEPATS